MAVCLDSLPHIWCEYLPIYECVIVSSSFSPLPLISFPNSPPFFSLFQISLLESRWNIIYLIDLRSNRWNYLVTIWCRYLLEVESTVILFIELVKFIAQVLPWIISKFLRRIHKETDEKMFVAYVAIFGKEPINKYSISRIKRSAFPEIYRF